MIRATTPTFTLTIKDEDLDLSQANNVYVAIKQGLDSLEITGSDLEIDRNVIHCFIPQEKSLQLVEGTAKIQVNWTYTDETENTKRAATRVKEIVIGEQLIRRVLE